MPFFEPKNSVLNYEIYFADFFYFAIYFITIFLDFGQLSMKSLNVAKFYICNFFDLSQFFNILILPP